MELWLAGVGFIVAFIAGALWMWMIWKAEDMRKQAKERLVKLEKRLSRVEAILANISQKS